MLSNPTVSPTEYIPVCSSHYFTDHFYRWKGDAGGDRGCVGGRRREPSYLNENPMFIENAILLS